MGHENEIIATESMELPESWKVKRGLPEAVLLDVELFDFQV